MKYTPFLAALFGLAFFACSDDSSGLAAKQEEEKQDSVKTIVPVDYTKGRAMNARLGKGMNLGNAWESACYQGNLPSDPYNYGNTDRLDACWSNPIEDSDFEFVKSQGFNSVRIPVRWQHNSNPETHKVSPERLAGVIEDVGLAFKAGLAVVISFHWYYELMEAANSGDAKTYKKEKEHFVAIWKEVAEAFEKAYPGSDSLLVWDILNEPTMKSDSLLNDAMTAGYKAIRSVAPGKTIMFESYHAAKFADIDKLTLPEDGNIIYSGHYYEPYSYTHQGHGYTCVGDEAYKNSAATDLKSYVAKAKALYPDVDGTHFVPMNLGEFGVAISEKQCEWSDKGGNPPSDRTRKRWVEATIKAAEQYSLSWHYWGFTKVGGFEAYNRDAKTWYNGFPDMFTPAK